jgi:hypothetical protein
VIDPILIAICARCLADHAKASAPVASAASVADRSAAIRRSLRPALCCVSGQDLAAHVARRSCPAAKFPPGQPSLAAPAKPIEPLPRENWTLWARALARLAVAGDRGLGDVIERHAKAARGDRFSAWLKKRGIDCGCAGRREWFNARYPLAAQCHRSEIRH